MTKKFDRVFLIGVDGAGTFFREADTPCLDGIMKNGACTYEADTAIPTSSAVCWGAMLLGVGPETHGLTNSHIEVHEYPTDSPYPTVFRKIREAYPDAALASFSNWRPINHGIVEHDLGVTLDSAVDRELTDKILDYLDENDPKFLFVQYDIVDGIGHEAGYGSPAHLYQIHETDAYIGRIYDKLSDRGLLEGTLFLVTTDHGGTPHKTHGGVSEAELKIYFGAAGDGVVKGGRIGETFVWDTAAVVLEALGIPVPDYADDGFIGVVPDGLFENFTPKERHYTLKAGHVSSPPVPCDAAEKLSAAGDLRCALFFEGDVADALGKCESVDVGRIKYYGTGVYSTCAELGKRGHVKLPTLKVGADSFTVSTFIYRDGAKNIGHEPSLFGTKSRVLKKRETERDGFTFVYTGDKTEVRIWSEGCCAALPLTLPTDASGWVNVTAVFNRKEGKVTQYCNFERCAEADIPAELMGASFDCDVFTVGTDASGVENEYMNLTFDDFLIYKGALDGDGLSVLREYYNM